MPSPKSINQIVSRYSKDNLMNILNSLQEKQGYISEQSLRLLSKKSKIPFAKLYSTATFYSFLKTKKSAKRTIRVCNSPSCYLNSSANIINTIKKLTGLKQGESNKKFNFEITQCIGCCDNPPAMMLDSKVYTNLTPEKISSILRRLK